MNIWISMISGVMFGLEWEYHYGFVVLDLGIIRVLFDYSGVRPVEYTSQGPKDDSTNLLKSVAWRA